MLTLGAGQQGGGGGGRQQRPSSVEQHASMLLSSQVRCWGPVWMCLAGGRAGRGGGCYGPLAEPHLVLPPNSPRLPRPLPHPTPNCPQPLPPVLLLLLRRPQRLFDAARVAVVTFMLQPVEMEGGEL